jgi:hypothetical protein
MINSDEIRYRINNIFESLEALENKWPDIAKDSIGAPSGQICYLYKTDINKYKHLKGFLKVNLSVYNAVTGKRYGV